MTLSLVVAAAGNGVIGREGGLPWRLATDMKRFKGITMGHPVVMGRKTWESFPRPGPLPGRTNIVVTRDSRYRAEGAIVSGSLRDALEIAARSAGGDDIYVIGGGAVFADAMDEADRLHVTHIEADIAGDTLFPHIDPALWYAVHEENVPAGEKDDFASRYVIYERRDARPDGKTPANG